MRTPRSLVGRLVLTFLLPSLAILIAGATIVYTRSASALRDSVFERLDAIASLKVAAFDAWIDHQLRDVVFLSELPSLAEHARDLIAEEVPAPRRRVASERLSRLLGLKLGKTPNFTEVFFLAPTGGRVVASTEPRNVGTFRIYDRYYVEGRRAPFVQNVYPSPLTLRPTLTISAPVAGDGGEVLGVLAAHLSLADLDQDVLGHIGLGRGGAVTLVDRHRVSITGTRYGGETLGAVGPSRAIDEVIQGRSGGGTYRDVQGAAVIGVYRWLDDRELGLIVELPQREAFAPARRLALTILLAGSVFLALLVGGIYLAASRIARPILEIAGAAARVRKGDLTARAPAPTRDEIGTLAETFNLMVEQLVADMENRRQAEETRERLIAELEAKNEELERFTYTVSHDLKSPLLTIKGFLGYLEADLESGDAERVRASARHISEAAEKMRNLLDDLLELSRVGRVVNPPEPVAFGELAREVAEAMMGRADADGVRIEVAGDLPVVVCDRVRLREVLENLVENAVKFARGGTAPRVEVGSRRDGGETVFFVRDNGRGVAPRYHEQIFGLFNRLDPSVEGTGVGLAIVRRIVDVHGGRIWVESKGEGAGSTFCFTLPAPE